MAREQREVRDLDEGSYVLIDGAAVRIDSYSTAKPGKHGSAKARVEGRGVFDGKKRNFSEPVDAKIWIPIIERKQGQVLNVDNGDAQIMDLETYDTFTMRVPDGIALNAEDEIEYLELDGQRKIV